LRERQIPISSLPHVKAGRIRNEIAKWNKVAAAAGLNN